VDASLLVGKTIIVIRRLRFRMCFSSKGGLRYKATPWY
jgi:hypothetical protein